MAGTMLVGYVVSAFLFAVAFIERQRWAVLAAILAVCVAFTAATLIRPVALGFDAWWTNGPTWRRAMNVVFMVVRVVALVIIVRVGFAINVR